MHNMITGNIYLKIRSKK